MVSRQVDKDATETRVYKYGLVPIGTFPEAAISELWRANNLWNNLVEIHRKNHDDYNKACCAAHSPYAEILNKHNAIKDEIKQAYDDKRTARMRAGTRDASHPLIKDADKIIARLKEKRKAIYAELKPIRVKADKLLKESGKKQELNTAFTEQANKIVRAKNSGLYSNTAGAVFENFKNARDRSFKTGGQLRFHTFDGTGFFAFRFRRKDAKVDGISFTELFVGNKPNAQRFAFTGRDDARKKPRIRLRATLAGGAVKAGKVMHEFDMIYHRPIPENSQIQNGKIMRIRIGDRFKYHLVLTIKQPLSKPVSVPKDQAIGIDIGFRRIGNSIQVATVTSSNPNSPPQEIPAPTKMIKGMERVIDLQSDLSDSAADLGAKIKPILKDNPLAEDHPKYKLWKAAALFSANVTLSFETAYKLARWLIDHDPNLIPATASKPVLDWWSAYSRRYREMHNLRAKQLLHRKHFYRQIAYDLVSRKQLIVLEEINLTIFAEVKDRNNKLSNKARAQRVLASPSEFRDAIINAANREGIPYISVPPQYTSKTCNACKKINKDLQSEKTWKCPHCGANHDRDENAALNIAELGKDYFFGKKMKEKPENSDAE